MFKEASVAQPTERRASDPEVAGSSPAGRAKFDRVAYQREYMRKLRAGKVRADQG